jgi:4-diphosphocytidyl-2-C-methyl-D-erythritol kinase
MTIVEDRLRAPAKVNLFLRVLGRRPDGYHLLDSLLLPISLYDELSIGVASARSGRCDPLRDVTVESDCSAAPGGPTNLAHRAACAFLDAVSLAATVDIRLHKEIPVGSGLGGGSSDAAAVVWGLNRALGSPLGLADLAALGAQIGADVPFFVHGRPARVAGIGEQVAPIDLPTPFHLVVCSNRCPLSTREVYARVDLSLTSGRLASSIQGFVSGRKPLSEILVNDLEAAVAQINPSVLSVKTALVANGAHGALLTGSGSAVFGIWPDSKSAIDAAVRLREVGLWAEAVETLNRSPVVDE